jgi:glutamate N-acetyltransferase/amino-acid N-acetyltransferase
MVVNGIKLGTACAQIKQAERDDLALLELAPESSCAAVIMRLKFTLMKFV